MSGSRTYAFRLEADAAPLEAAYARAEGATHSFQSATEAFSALTVGCALQAPSRIRTGKADDNGFMRDSL